MDLAHLQALGLQTVRTAAFVLARRCRLRGKQRTPACYITPSAPLLAEEGAPDTDEDERPAKAVRCEGAASSGEKPAPTGPPPVQFLDLPDIADALGAVCCDPQLLTRLALTQRSLCDVIFGPGFAERRAGELKEQGLDLVGSCTSLEQIAVGMAVEVLCARSSKNHLYFPYGGGLEVLPVTKPILEGAARLARRHGRLRLHVDTHTGAGAPPGVATSCSQQRARVVKQQLASKGVSPARLSSTCWGKKVSMVWSEPEDNTAARAEVFFRFDGVEFPQRASYYKLVPEGRRPQEGEADPGTSSDDDLGLMTARGLLVRMLHRR